MESRSWADVCLVLILLLRYCTAQLLFPVDGQWGEWQSWGPCSETCGIGYKSRRHLCDSPARANGGDYCLGGATETQGCIWGACPVVADLKGSGPHTVPASVIAGKAVVGGLLVTAAIAVLIIFSFVRCRGRNTRTKHDGHVNTSSATSPERGTTAVDIYVDVSGVGTVRPSDRQDGSCTNPDSSAADSSSTATSSATTTGAAVQYQNVGDPSHNNYERLDVSTLGLTSVYAKLKKANN